MNPSIIGINGKIGSGKDTVGKIIQYLTVRKKEHVQHDECIEDFNAFAKIYPQRHCDWKVVKFADKLKECVSIVTGISREDLEKEEVKNSKLGEEWIRYGYADSFYRDRGDQPIMNNVQYSKERYEEELRTNWQTAYKHEYTVRDLLQLFGTEVGRAIHSDFWVNALFSEYKPKICSGVTYCALAGKPEISCNQCPEYPNWIITDVRFPNEAKAIKDRGGITIRINRNETKLNEIIRTTIGQHPSETALDNAKFDYTIDNNSTIEDLIIKTREILIKERILMP